MKTLKISFCVVCMNRLHQLKETFLKNIEDNNNYKNLEFIILNYNSQDNMEEWVLNNVSDHIKTGKIVYYRTPDPQVFSHSHSKNMAFRLATGDIVCNINADHFIGKNFADYINEQFNNDSAIVITPIDFFKTQPLYRPAMDVMGKVCVKKSDFNRVTGFDENMGNYGFEDCDFVNRLELAGIRRFFIKEQDYLKFIPHSNAERYPIDKITGDVYAFYVSYQSPSASEILFLYKNRSYKSGTIVDNSSLDSNDPLYAYVERVNHFEFGQKESEWITGKWTENDSCLKLSTSYLNKGYTNGHEILTEAGSNKVYYKIKDEEIIKNIAYFLYTHLSRAVLERNLENKTVIVNKTFGKGLVYKNFNNEKPIYI